MKIFIAKKNTWFKEKTEVELLFETISGCGLFKGIHKITDKIDAKNRNKNIGDEVEDEEMCSFDEFYIKDK